jgi:hypothetical protein
MQKNGVLACSLPETSDRKNRKLEDSSFLRHDAMVSGKQLLTFQRIFQPPFLGLMESKRSLLMAIYKLTQHYIPDDLNLHQQSCEKLTSHTQNLHLGQGFRNTDTI